MIIVLMFYEVFTHEYFWLSFLPISLLGVGFWFLLFERSRKQKDPLILFVLAILAGGGSAMLFGFLGEFFGVEHWLAKVFGEEFCKMLCAIFIMEIFSQRFKTVAGGIVFGFSVGIGFALVENLVYLTSAYEMGTFGPEFWLVFQGRLWSSTILHGVTTAIFGLFYAGAFLAKTVYKGSHKSPLRVFFIPPSFQAMKNILTFHFTREHLLFKNQNTLEEHRARPIILEGFLVAFFIHVLFNLAMDQAYPAFSFFIALFFVWFLCNKMKKVGGGDN